MPGLEPVAAVGIPDVRIRFGRTPPNIDSYPRAKKPWYISPYLNSDGEPMLVGFLIDGGAYFHLRYSDGTEFYLSRAGDEVWCRWTEPSSLEDATSYLLGPIIGILLRVRGVVCLHASSIAIEGAAIAIVGPEGTGKSTTATAFAERGHPVLSDDIVPLLPSRGQWLAEPGYARLRLWPSSVSLLSDLSSSFPRLPLDWGDRRYHLDFARHGYTFQISALPLRAIYVFAERTTDSRAPFFETVTARQALMALVENSFAGPILDRQMRAREFDQLSDLVASVTVRRMHPHSDPAYLPHLCDLIRDDVAALKPVWPNKRPVQGTTA